MSSSRKKLFGIILLVASLVCIPRFSNALGQIGIQDSDITVDTIPDNPEPYQDVTINLSSYATDLNKATIVWTSGSSTVLSGIGRTSYSFKTLGPNTNTNINISITPSDDPTNTITKQITISPSEIEILWESVDGYTPPFYRGKSFATPESVIKAVAIPNTGTISGKSSVAYTWKNNGSAVTSASGYNKDSYVFANNELNKSEQVSVSASSVDGSYNATQTVQIPIVQPQISFYEKSPTQGVLYNRALDDSTFVSGDEMTVVAVPYFLATVGNEDKFNYNWQINGSSIATPSNRTELTVHPTSRGGYATIDLTLENLSTFFQKVSGELKLNL